MLLLIYDSPISMGYILDQNVWENRDPGVFLLLNQVLDLINSKKKAANPCMWNVGSQKGQTLAIGAFQIMSLTFQPLVRYDEELTCL